MAKTCSRNTVVRIFYDKSSQWESWAHSHIPWGSISSIRDQNDIVLCHSVQFNSVQSISHVQLFVTHGLHAACQASLSITNAQSILKLMSIELVIPPNHLIFCSPLLLLPSIFPRIRVFSSESVLHIRWPKYWSFTFSSRPSNEHPGLISFRTDWLDLLAVQGALKSLLQH